MTVATSEVDVSSELGSKLMQLGENRRELLGLDKQNYSAYN